MAESLMSNTLLRSFIPLSGLSDEQLDVLLSQCQLDNYFKGQNLLEENPGQHSLYLVHGSVREVQQEKDVLIEAGSAAAAYALPQSSGKLIADSDCGVLKVDTQRLEKLLCWSQVARCLLAELAIKPEYQRDYFWIQKLLQSKLFYKVPPTNIRQILSRFKEKSVKAGDSIIRQGEDGSCCYLIKSGKAQVSLEQQEVAQLGAGEVFGEDALVNNKPRNASVVMLSDGVLLHLEKQDFYQLMIQPAVTMLAANNLAGFVDSGAGLIDVRTEQEYERGHYHNAINIPLNLCLLKAQLLNKDKLYIVYSATEERARAGAYLLSEQGFQAYALQTGLSSASAEQTAWLENTV